MTPDQEQYRSKSGVSPDEAAAGAGARPEQGRVGGQSDLGPPDLGAVFDQALDEFFGAKAHSQKEPPPGGFIKESAIGTGEGLADVAAALQELFGDTTQGASPVFGEDSGIHTSAPAPATSKPIRRGRSNQQPGRNSPGPAKKTLPASVPPSTTSFRPQDEYQSRVASALAKFLRGEGSNWRQAAQQVESLLLSENLWASSGTAARAEDPFQFAETVIGDNETIWANSRLGHLWAIDYDPNMAESATDLILMMLI